MKQSVSKLMQVQGHIWQLTLKCQLIRYDEGKQKERMHERGRGQAVSGNSKRGRLGRRVRRPGRRRTRSTVERKSERDWTNDSPPRR